MGTLVNSLKIKPRYLAFDQHSEFIYFTDASTPTPSIQRVSLNTLFNSAIIDTNLRDPKSLAVDDSRIYWSDVDPPIIYSCSFRGENW